MDRWQNRVAAVTGASSGIGAACCRDLVAKGMIVVGMARRQERLSELKASLPAGQRERFHALCCDVSDEQAVIRAFDWINKQLGGADVLVNNAGITQPTKIIEAGNSNAMRSIIETNVLGVSWCTREWFISMEQRKINDGHVLIINSLAGHIVPQLNNYSFNMYAPSKHAITAMAEVLRQEFRNKGTKTKVTSISPGLVDTEIIGATNKKFDDMPMLRSEDVADAVSYSIQTPPHMQIHEMIIRPVGEMF